MVTLALASLLASGLGAQESGFRAAVLGAVGGAIDSDGPDPGLDQTGFQLGLAIETFEQSLIVIRAGELDFDDVLGTRFEPTLRYVTLGGEYRFREAFYESGVFFGLGGYQLDGEIAPGVSDDDSSFGINAGVTADFPITRRLWILTELSAHYTDLDDATFFGMLHAGVSWRF